MIFCRANKVLRPPGMPFGRVLYAKAGYNPLVAYNCRENAVFSVFGSGARANFLNDNVRVPFHYSSPPFCLSSQGHFSTSSEVAISTSPRQFSRYSFPLSVSLPMTVKISSSKSNLILSP